MVTEISGFQTQKGFDLQNQQKSDYFWGVQQSLNEDLTPMDSIDLEVAAGVLTSNSEMVRDPMHFIRACK